MENNNVDGSAELVGDASRAAQCINSREHTGAAVTASAVTASAVTASAVTARAVTASAVTASAATARAVTAATSHTPRAAPRRQNRRWSEEETSALVEGFLRYGEKWAVIKKDFPDILAARTSVDLKDKWRNLSSIGGKKRRTSLVVDLKAKLRKLSTTRGEEKRSSSLVDSMAKLRKLSKSRGKQKRSCLLCRTTRTSQWRKGGTLCNACGVAQMKGRSSKHQATRLDCFNIRQWWMQLELEHEHEHEQEQEVSHSLAASTHVRPRQQRRRKQNNPVRLVELMIR